MKIGLVYLLFLMSAVMFAVNSVDAEVPKKSRHDLPNPDIQPEIEEVKIKLSSSDQIIGTAIKNG